MGIWPEEGPQSMEDRDPNVINGHLKVCSNLRNVKIIHDKDSKKYFVYLIFLQFCFLKTFNGYENLSLIKHNRQI